MEYKIGNITITLKINEDKDSELFQECCFTFTGGDLNRSYQKLYNEYLGKDFLSTGIVIPYLENLKYDLTDLEYENPDTDLDFIIEDYKFNIIDLFESAIILRHLIDTNKKCAKSIDIDFLCKNPIEFYFVLSLSQIIDMNNIYRFIEEDATDFNKVTTCLVKAFKKLSESGLKHLYTKDIHEDVCDYIDDLFDKAFECKEIEDHLSL